MKTRSFIAHEIEKTDRAVREAGYRGDIQFRAPAGRKRIGLPWRLAQRHRKHIPWDFDPLSDRDVAVR